jgi:ribonuclease HI
MLFDPANAVVSQDDKYVGQGMSWHVAEYTALLEGLTVARSLNLKHIVAYGTSRIVCNQVRYDVFLTDFFWFPAAYSVAGTDMNAKYPRGPTRGCIDQ